MTKPMMHDRGAAESSPVELVRYTRYWPIGLIAVGALVVNYFLPQASTNPNLAWSGPRGIHALGFDGSGASIAHRLLLATTHDLYVAAAGGVTTALVGLSIGLLSGLIGGNFDRIRRGISVALDALGVFLIALVVVAALPRISPLGLCVFLGFVGWPALAEVAAAEVRAVSRSDWYVASCAAGIPRARLALVHLLPPVLIRTWPIGVSQMGQYFALLSFVSFFGLSGGTNSVTLGAILWDSLSFLRTHPAYFLSSFISCVAAIACLNVVAGRFTLHSS